DFVESAKNFMSAAVGRTSWEAQKQMRVRGKQGEIDKIVDQRHQLLDELAKIVMNLYQQGMLAEPQLMQISAKILELDQDIREHEAQLQEIKKESFSAEQHTPPPTSDYTPPPSSSARSSQPSQPSQPPKP